MIFTTCTCGHEIEDHENEVGICTAPGCLYCGYEQIATADIDMVIVRRILMIGRNANELS